MTDLAAMVEAVEAKYPGVMYKRQGSRAQQAAELVVKQQVQQIEASSGKKDLWRVGDHTCSISSGNCTCLDELAPLDDKGGKLCKHRIAAMFAFKLRQAHGIEAVLRSASGNQVTLIVQVLFTDHGRQYTLSGWRSQGQTATLEYAERIRFTEREFSDALAAAGWGMTQRPVKQAGMTYHYIVTRGAELCWAAGAMTGDDVDRLTQHRRMEEIAALDQGEHANIMQGLPESVQAAILEHAGLSR